MFCQIIAQVVLSGQVYFVIYYFEMLKVLLINYNKSMSQLPLRNVFFFSFKFIGVDGFLIDNLLLVIVLLISGRKFIIIFR